MVKTFQRAVRYPFGFLVMCLLIAGCSSTYYAAWEAMGKEKRDLLRDNVEKARRDQSTAQEEFKDALTRLKELTGFQGGDLEKTYDAVKKDYDRCTERAETLRSRVKTVNEVANDLFVEWQREIAQIESGSMKRDSEKKLQKTQERYADLYDAMQRAEKQMDPVLSKLKDNVLYLKHNLNAQAIGALDKEVLSIEQEVQKLIRDMETSIAKSDEFLASFGG